MRGCGSGGHSFPSNMVLLQHVLGVRHATQLVVGALGISFVAWSLLRGRRWAWYVAIYYAGFVSVAGTLAVVVMGIRLFVPGAPVPGFAQPHLFETAMGALSVALCLACVIHLRKKETRDYFSLGKQSGLVL